MKETNDYIKDLTDTPDKFTHKVKINFDHTKYKQGKPFDVYLTFEDGREIPAVLYPEFCSEFGVLINNESYYVSLIDLLDGEFIFDYKIAEETPLFQLATKQWLTLEASEEYKLNPKLVYEISGRIESVEAPFECSLYSFDADRLYKKIIVYDEELKKEISLKPDIFVKMTVLEHEASLSVLSFSEIPYPTIKEGE